MNNYVAPADIRVHELGVHGDQSDMFTELRGMLDAACDQLDEVRRQLAEHIDGYHAPEPEPEPEPEPTPEPEPEPEPIPEPEPAPAPDVPPTPDHPLFRRLGRREE